MLVIFLAKIIILSAILCKKGTVAFKGLWSGGCPHLCYPTGGRPDHRLEACATVKSKGKSKKIKF